ncbi:hypothetical protein I6E68_09490 [Salinibacterium sp. NSLL150]|uniref:hypothetical protein n=1 Tax=unclassified Salinibacterium TaxID=2632331 RepID=UPI0018CCFEB7|nr:MULTISPECIES: hypothetical protein [unclassified Salinibacterium]MBH0099372.1 hypothetical protein [Salinibacterium sp. NSLL35]MBH0102126.1 hypothetical protein [Salinibacterium sp. NSLL150]MBH0104886.1 hypothetical protein [Salinibacterium sp. NSLL16]MBH0107646.1 hypothetical protein [Salinibacterium sp. NSLL17]
MFTDREIASLLLFAAFAVFGLTKRGARKALVQLIRVFLGAHQIWGPTLVYVLYAASWISLSWLLRAWEWPMLKDTVIVVLGVGFPMLFRSINAKSGGEITRRVVMESIGDGAIVALYVNLTSLNLIAEILLQSVVVLAAAVSVYARHSGGENLAAARLMDGLLVVVGLGMLSYTTVWLVLNAWTLDLPLLGRTVAMSVWLPFALLPFVYGLSFYAGIESIYVRLPSFNQRKQPPLRVRLGILMGLRGSVRYAKGFVGQWLREAGQTKNWRETTQLMVRYREAIGSGDPI